MKQLLFILSVLFLFSCKKEREVLTEPDNTQVNSFLLVGKWALIGSTISPAYDINGDGIAETNRYLAMPECFRDFNIEFANGGMGSVKQNCHSVYKSIVWYLLNNGNSLRWKFVGEYDIQEEIVFISTTSLQTEIVIEPIPNTYHTITNFYTKQ